jgi:hypothetical protein
VQDIEFWVVFFIGNSIKLLKMLLEGKIGWVTSSHLGQLYSKFLGGNFVTFFTSDGEYIEFRLIFVPEN